MKLTATQDYALRIVSHLRDRGDRYVGTSEISESINASRAYIIQLTTKLKQAGIIESLQGKEGGYRLKGGVEPTVVDVLRAFEVNEAKSTRDRYVPSPERIAVEAAVRSALDVALSDLVASQKADPCADEPSE